MAWFDAVESAQWLWRGYAVTLNVTVFLLGMSLLALLARRAHPSVRAHVWAAAILGMLLILAACAPWYGSGREVLPAAWHARVLPVGLASPMLALGSEIVVARVAAEGAIAAQAGVPWTAVVCLIWFVGGAWVLARIARGWWAIHLVTRSAARIDDEHWLRLQAEIGGTLGIRRRVTLRRTVDVGTPLTWGTLRPVILLPANAGSWPAGHRRAVLLHELEHVRRNDCAIQILGQIACAIFWFHPLVWWSLSRLHVAREDVCDARVLLAGVRRSEYAECLMRVAELARVQGAASSIAVTAGLARPTRLQDRLVRILTPERSPGSSRLHLLANAFAAILIFGASASLRLGPDARVFRNALSAPDWSMRTQAVLYFSYRPTPEASRIAEQALARDPDERVRTAVRLLIGKPH